MKKTNYTLLRNVARSLLRQLSPLRLSIVAFTLAATAHAQSMSLDTHIMAQWLEFPRSAVSAATTQGNYAYLYLYNDQLLVLDTSTPANPTLVTAIEIKCDPSDMQAVGNYLYVAGGYYGLLTIDIANPANPQLISTFQLPNYAPATKIAINGNLAYICSAGGGPLHIFDITDPGDPILLSTFEAEFNISGAAVIGNTLFITYGNAGLKLLDTTDPTDPQLIGSCSIPDTYFTDIAIKGNYAYLTTDWGNSITIVDISTPTTPTVAGSWTTQDLYFEHLAIDGNYLYLASGDNGLLTLNIATPTAPQLVDTFIPDDGFYLFHLTPFNNHVLVADSYQGVRIVDISDPEDLSETSRFVTAGTTESVAIAGNYAYLADGDAGLQIIDISDPKSPQKVGTCLTGGAAEHVIVAGNFAYVVNIWGDQILQVVDISQPNNPQKRGSCPNPYINPYNAVLHNNTLYLSCDWEGLYTIDLTDPDSPQLSQNSIVSYDEAGALSVDNNRLFLFAFDDDYEWQGIKVLNLAPGSNYELLASYEVESYVDSLAVKGSHLYTLSDNTLYTYDISDLNNIAEVSDLPLYWADKLVISGNYAYAFSNYGDLIVIDITTPNTPQIVGYCEKPYATNVAVVDDRIYIASPNDGLLLAKLGNPAGPQVKNTLNYSYYVDSLTLSGSYAFMLDSYWGHLYSLSNIGAPEPEYLDRYDILSYVTCPNAIINQDYLYLGIYDRPNYGIEIVDISDPDSIQYVDTYEGLDSDPLSMALSGNYLYIATSYSGIQVLDLSNPISLVDYTTIPDINATQIIITNNHLYAAAGEDGLYIIDITNPATPTIKSHIPTSHSTLSMALGDNHLYILDEKRAEGIPTRPANNAVPMGMHTDSWMTLRSFDITNLAAPVELDTLSYYGYGWQLLIKDEYLYIAAYEQGVIVVDITDPSEMQRLTSNRAAAGATYLVADNHNLYASCDGNGLVIISLYGEIDTPDHTTTTTVPVPYNWLDHYGLVGGNNDYEAAALADTDGDGMPNWQEYVAGTDPTDPDSRLIALINQGENGDMIITWDPDLGNAREYQVWGRESLTDGAWSYPAPIASRFFKVRVNMPQED